MSDWKYLRHEHSDFSRPPDFESQTNNNSTVRTEATNNCAPVKTLRVTNISLDKKLDNTLRFLNEELSVMGFNSIFEVENNEVRLDVRILVNVAYELVNLYRKSLKEFTNLQDDRERLKSDLDVYHRKNKLLQHQMEAIKQQLAESMERERQHNARIRQLTKQFKQEKDEVSRTKSALSQIEAQFRHEKKKMEREVSSLRDHLHTLVTPSGGGGITKPANLEMINSLTQLEGRRQVWARPKGGAGVRRSQEELVNTRVRQLEEDKTGLLLENRDLRECLVRMQRQLGSLAGDGEGAVALTRADSEEALSCADSVYRDTDSTMTGISGPMDDLLLNNMPFDLMKENLHSQLETTWRKLAARIVQASSDKQQNQTVAPVVRQHESQLESPTARRASITSALSAGYREEVDHLKRQITQCEKTIQKQEDLLKRAILGTLLRTPVTSPSPGSRDASSNLVEPAPPRRSTHALHQQLSSPLLSQRKDSREEMTRTLLGDASVVEKSTSGFSSSLRRESPLNTTFLLRNRDSNPRIFTQRSPNPVSSFAVDAESTSSEASSVNRYIDGDKYSMS